jgi:hypothetical protein
MIINEFSKILNDNEQEIINGKTSLEFLMEWIKEILYKKPKTNIEKIIHTEIALCENKLGDYFLVAKSESGRILTSSLYEFCKTFDRHILRKWLQDKQATDFHNSKEN